MGFLLTSNIWLIAIVVFSNAIGQILFKVAANAVKTQTDIQLIIGTLIRLPAMWLALVFYGATVVAWIWVLRLVPLSVAYSAVALVFIIVPAAGALLFNEPISMRFVLGSIFIGFGVWLACFG